MTDLVFGDRVSAPAPTIYFRCALALELETEDPRRIQWKRAFIHDLDTPVGSSTVSILYPLDYRPQTELNDGRTHPDVKMNDPFFDHMPRWDLDTLERWARSFYNYIPDDWNAVNCWFYRLRGPKPYGKYWGTPRRDILEKYVANRARQSGTIDDPEWKPLINSGGHAKT